MIISIFTVLAMAVSVSILAFLCGVLIGLLLLFYRYLINRSPA